MYDKEAIIEYGEAKYAIGYKDGYVAGVVTGILCSVCIMTISLIINRLKV